jgi:hypothetical protein
MATEPATPDRASLEAQARQLLEAARRSSGATVEEIVKTLGELQPRGAETRRSWYDWQERPETISLLTGIASMHLLGPAATMDLIFGTDRAETVSSGRTSDEGLAALRRSVSDLASEVAGLREQMEGLIVPELTKQAQMLARLADSSVEDMPDDQSSRAQASGG